VIGRDGSRDEAIAKYRAWIVRQPALMAALHELRSKDLVCWCARPSAATPMCSSNWRTAEIQTEKPKQANRPPPSSETASPMDQDCRPSDYLSLTELTIHRELVAR
jgi:hypothetical protein